MKIFRATSGQLSDLFRAPTSKGAAESARDYWNEAETIHKVTKIVVAELLLPEGQGVIVDKFHYAEVFSVDGQGNVEFVKKA